MATRRQFLQGSLAVGGAALASLSFAGSRIASMIGPPPPRLTLQGVVFDPGQTQSAAFATAAKRQGLKAFPIGDDITPVWAQLVELWRTTPVPIAGLTTHTPLLLLEQSGRDHGLRTIFRAEHRPGDDGQITHSLSGAPEIIAAFRLAARREPGFGTCLAHAFAQCPAQPGERESRSLRTPANGPPTGTLYSWVLAPRNALSQGAIA